MKDIAKELDIVLNAGKSLTTYVARHTFSTVLKRKGVPIDEISEFLGHSDIGTTKSYLDSFTDDNLQKRSQLLTN